MKFKKLTALLLGLAMAVSLTACGEKDPKPAETTAATEITETTEATEAVEAVDLTGSVWYGEKYVVLFEEDGGIKVATPNGNESYYGEYTFDGEFGEIQFLSNDSEFSFSVEEEELFIFSLEDDSASALFISSADEAVQNGLKAKEILTANAWTDGESEFVFDENNNFTMSSPDMGVLMTSYLWNPLTQEGIVTVDEAEISFTVEDGVLCMDGIELEAVGGGNSDLQTGDLENVLWDSGELLAFFLEDGTMVVANPTESSAVTGTYTWDGSSGVGTPDGTDESCQLSLHDDGLHLEEDGEVLIFSPLSNSYASDMDPDPLENMLDYSWLLEADGDSMLMELYDDGTLEAETSSGDAAEGSYTWDGVSGTATLDGVTVPMYFVGGFLLVNYVPMTPME